LNTVIAVMSEEEAIFEQIHKVFIPSIPDFQNRKI
jgi:hypothetical protein